MAEDFIRYDILTQDALRSVVRKVLAEVSRTGLPGDHHFYISFLTTAPGVRISTRLLNEYPEEMTIVVQHQFWDLKVTDTSFEIGLSFGSTAEKLLVPFSAIKSFADPSVQFGLQFQTMTAAEVEQARRDAAAADDDAPEPTNEAEPADEDPEGDEAPGAGQPAEVVSLDAFRKK